MTRTAFVVIALLTLTACQPETHVPDNNSVPGNLKIEIYSTGETPVDEIERRIKALFPSGNVRALSKGRIAVAAPSPQQPHRQVPIAHFRSPNKRASGAI